MCTSCHWTSCVDEPNKEPSLEDLSAHDGAKPKVEDTKASRCLPNHPARDSRKEEGKFAKVEDMKASRCLPNHPVSDNRKEEGKFVDHPGAEEGKFVDLPGAEEGKVVLRFPPEASGYVQAIFNLN